LQTSSGVLANNTSSSSWFLDKDWFRRTGADKQDVDYAGKRGVETEACADLQVSRWPLGRIRTVRKPRRAEKETIRDTVGRLGRQSVRIESFGYGINFALALGLVRFWLMHWMRRFAAWRGCLELRCIHGS
jgi:hypothetical protein